MATLSHTQAQNMKLLDSFIAALSKINLAEECGDKKCPAEREQFGQVYSKLLAQLDGVQAPFKQGQLVRLRRNARIGDRLAPLEYERAYTVCRAHYNGGGLWMLVLEEFLDDPHQTRFSANQFEKAKIVRAR